MTAQRPVRQVRRMKNMREIQITRREYPSFSEADVPTRDCHEPCAVVKCVLRDVSLVCLYFK